MGKFGIDGLRKLREEKRRELHQLEAGGERIQITVAMGTSGIAAGARETLNAFADELEQHDLKNVTLRRTGSMGLDHAEPTVEVRVPTMPTVIYGKVTPELATKIVRKHVLGKVLINDYIFDRPAADIIDDAEARDGV